MCCFCLGAPLQNNTVQNNTLNVTLPTFGCWVSQELAKADGHYIYVEVTTANTTACIAVLNKAATCFHPNKLV
jgi:hypothetical protein